MVHFKCYLGHGASSLQKKRNSDIFSTINSSVDLIHLRSPSLWSNHFPKTTFLNTYTGDQAFNTWMFLEDGNTADSNSNKQNPKIFFLCPSDGSKVWMVVPELPGRSSSHLPLWWTDFTMSHSLLKSELCVCVCKMSSLEHSSRGPMLGTLRALNQYAQWDWWNTNTHHRYSCLCIASVVYMPSQFIIVRLLISCSFEQHDPRAILPRVKAFI